MSWTVLADNKQVLKVCSHDGLDYIISNVFLKSYVLAHNFSLYRVVNPQVQSIRLTRTWNVTPYSFPSSKHFKINLQVQQPKEWTPNFSSIQNCRTLCFELNERVHHVSLQIFWANPHFQLVIIKKTLETKTNICFHLVHSNLLFSFVLTRNVVILFLLCSLQMLSSFFFALTTNAVILFLLCSLQILSSFFFFKLICFFFFNHGKIYYRHQKTIFSKITNFVWVWLCRQRNKP